MEPYGLIVSNIISNVKTYAFTIPAKPKVKHVMMSPSLLDLE
jgi:hypothetical protein